jgi:hypothetical protein
MEPQGMSDAPGTDLDAKSCFWMENQDCQGVASNGSAVLSSSCPRRGLEARLTSAWVEATGVSSAFNMLPSFM